MTANRCERVQQTRQGARRGTFAPRPCPDKIYQGHTVSFPAPERHRGNDQRTILLLFFFCGGGGKFLTGCRMFIVMWANRPPLPSLPLSSSPESLRVLLLPACRFVSPLSSLLACAACMFRRGCLFSSLSASACVCCVFFFSFQCKHTLESSLGDSTMTKASPEYVKVSSSDERNDRSKRYFHTHPPIVWRDPPQQEGPFYHFLQPRHG